MANPIIVGSGVVRFQDKILITQRGNSGDFVNFWEFPGGKRQADESIQECIIREILEETSLQVKLEQQLDIIPFMYPHKEVELHFWLCSSNSGSVQLNGPTKYEWIKPSSLNLYNFPPANLQLVKKIEQNLYQIF